MKKKDSIISLKAQPESVDMENRIIRNVIIAQVGEAQGHGFSVEQNFIEDVVAQSQAGVKSNLGHNRDNMGKQLGRLTNVHTTESAALGDLNVYKNADSVLLNGAPMGQWVLNQAQEDPSSLMLSIRFSAKYFYQYNADGNEEVLKSDMWGDAIPQFKNKPIYAKLNQLKSVDVVDDGALTDAMFSENESNNLLSSFWNFIKGKNMNNIDKVELEVGGGTNDGGYVWLGGTKFQAEDVQALSAQNVELKASEKELRTQTETLNNSIVELNAQVEALKAENKILSDMPSAILTNGATGNTPAENKTDVELSALGKALKNAIRK